MQPADMLGAGVMGPEQDTGGLIDALRSRGTLPNDLVPMMLAGPQTSPWQAIAEAAAGGVTSMRGQPNPVTQSIGLQQQQQGRQMQTLMSLLENAANQQYRTAQLVQQQQRIGLEAQRLEEDRLKREADAKQKAYAADVALGEKFLTHDNPTVRAKGGELLVGAMKAMGRQDVPEGFVTALADKRITPNDSNDILKRMFMGYTDEQITSLYPAASPTALADLRKIKDNPDPNTMKSLGLMTKDDLEKSALENQIKAAQVLESKFPELKGDPKLVHETLMQARALYGKDYQEIPKDSQLKAYQAAQAKVQADEEAKIRMQADLKMEAMLAGVDARLKAAMDMRANSPTNFLSTEKAVEGPLKKITVVKQIDEVLGRLDQMDKKGALPKSGNMASMLTAKLYRNTTLKGDNDVFTFQQLWGPLSIGQIDRNIFDEKGVRAISAFGKQLDAVDNMPPASAMRSYLGSIRKQLVDESLAYHQRMVGLGAPPQAIAEVEKIISPFSIKDGTGPTPGLSSPSASPFNPPKIRVRVRNNATGQERDATMNPGDMIPPGWSKVD